MDEHTQMDRKTHEFYACFWIFDDGIYAISKEVVVRSVYFGLSPRTKKKNNERKKK